MIDAAADQLFALLQRFYNAAAHDRDAVKHRFHMRFGVEIFGVGAQLG